ncbi:unnamed protein product [Hydatigera taeniaeformis]|uniref:glutathione-specific gamma-glutamylcyclotransferase n=1 Tax=Hydatigena taeniaeformis TaxID=6205 RepID=A0A0R3X041_HYDTA|nr:unnamed protein product [Hydatigera taeniaeformis]
MAPNLDEKPSSATEVGHFTQNMCQERRKLYIFGYGSLIWWPNISYTRSWFGYIKGYKRRFYQGTTTHRGTQQNPGRVLTLLPSKNEEARVWGKAYEVDGAIQINSAIDSLAEREMILGGYSLKEVPFFPHRVVYENAKDQQDYQASGFMRVFVYIAKPGNDQYLGKAPLEVQVSRVDGEVKWNSRLHC